MADNDLLLAAPVATGLVYWVRKALDTPTRLPRWDRWLVRAWQPMAVIVGLGLLVGGPVLSWLDDLFLAVVLGLGLALGWRLRAYRPALLMALALLPYTAYQALLLVLQPLAPAWAKSDALDNAQGLALCWLGVLLLVARSQAKGLRADSALRLQAEQEQRAIESQNQTLEHEVTQRTAALARQTDELRAALHELQETQGQLVQKREDGQPGRTHGRHRPRDSKPAQLRQQLRRRERRAGGRAG